MRVRVRVRVGVRARARVRAGRSDQAVFEQCSQMIRLTF